MKNKTGQIRTMVTVGLMAALVFIFTYIRIEIPVSITGGKTMLHLGNVFCLLGGLLFGGIPGGLAAGFGSALFDLFSEYASEAWITFINKFAMGLVAGLIAHMGTTKLAGKAKAIVAAVFGSLTYCLLYIAKTIVMQRFVYGLPWEGVWPIVAVKGAVTLTNGMIAVIASLILYFVLKPALVRSHILNNDK